MPAIVKALIVITVVAIGFVIYSTQSQEADMAGWASYGTAEAQGYTLDSLEAARDQARDTPAEPWIAFQLASKLYESGGKTDLDRARQVAQDAITRFPDHPAAPWLRKLVAASESLAGVPDKT